MKNTPNARGEVRDHYTVDGLGDKILTALSGMGKDVDAMEIGDLAPVDSFHIRGRQSTDALAKRVRLEEGMRVLDVGSGIGGTARVLAQRYGVHVTGIDLTDAYCETATMLSARSGWSEQTRFVQGDATRLPFDDESFDVVWTEHVQMNIADKEPFYREMARVLAPGGTIAFHDIFLGPSGGPRFPVPWAEVARLSHLWPAADVRAILEGEGLEVTTWDDETPLAAEWFRQALERTKSDGPAPLGLHLLMGATARTKFENLLDALENHRVETIMAVIRKP